MVQLSYGLFQGREQVFPVGKILNNGIVYRSVIGLVPDHGKIVRMPFVQANALCGCLPVPPRDFQGLGQAQQGFRRIVRACVLAADGLQGEEQKTLPAADLKNALRIQCRDGTHGFSHALVHFLPRERQAGIAADPYMVVCGEVAFLRDLFIGRVVKMLPLLKMACTGIDMIITAAVRSDIGHKPFLFRPVKNAIDNGL